MTCKVPHDEDGLPQFLCRICHPNLNVWPESIELKGHRVAYRAPRDFRIPKGMSTEEGNEMLARRQDAKKQQQAEALANLMAKHEGEFYDKKLKKWLPNAAKGE